jgi:hypothetical protein
VPELATGLWQEELAPDEIEKLIRNQVHPFGPRPGPEYKSEVLKPNQVSELLARDRGQLAGEYPSADAAALLTRRTCEASSPTSWQPQMKRSKAGAGRPRLTPADIR